MKFLFLTYEAFLSAMQALRANVLRTILSLLGVTVGIFSIVGVYTMVDSLENNIKTSLASIGTNVIYVEKWPWVFGEGDYPWWRYFRRPMPKYEEYKYLKENMQTAKAVVMMSFQGNTPTKRGNNSMDVLCQGITYEYNEISDVPIENGRYFSQQEIDAARNVAVLGSEVAETLFEGVDPIGQTFKIKGINFVCIGIQQKKGAQLVDIGGNPDEKVLIPFITHKKLFSSGFSYGIITVKGFESDEGLVAAENEITGLLRTKRGLRPSEDDSFAINRPEAAAQAIAGIFSALRVGGFFIGIFSLLIGGFGIANIMFVSVKERTNVIGIQKSLGAQNFYILFQFLFEAIFLCLLGGFFGIMIVYLISLVPMGSLDLILTKNNVILGLVISSLIGVISGIVPAWSAAKMDPVEAIRSK